MSVVPLLGLPPEEQAVQDRAIAFFKENKEELIVAYRARFNVVVGTDLAREMFPEYAASLDSRLRFAGAVQRPASALADAAFDRIVSECNEGFGLFTGGGTGAGKTISIMRNGVAKAAFHGASVIFDGNFNSLKSSKSKLESVLGRQCRAVVVFVHRHPVAAYIKGVIPRALEQGRTVPIHAHLRMHRDAIATFLRVHKNFADNPNVSFIVLNNTGHELESFPQIDIDYLKAVKYDSPELEAAIRKGLTNELEEQRISQALYDASCGTPPT
jgi:hypothetical protein